MQFIQTTITYIISAIIICSIYNFTINRYILKKDKISKEYKFVLLCMIIYLSIIFALNISPFYGFSTTINWSDNLNLNPFRILHNFRFRLTSIIKEIAIFIPLGILLPLISKNFQRAHKSLIIGIFISLFIEIFQLFLYKGSDIDSVILSGVGTLIGYFIYKFSSKIKIYILKDKNNYFCKYKKDKSKNLSKLYDEKIIYFYGLMFLVFITVITTGFIMKFENLNFYNNKIQASNAYLINADNNNVIYDKDSDKKIAPASTTKMITAITVLDYCNIDEKVVVGDEIKYVCDDASKAGLKKGNILTVKQLLDGLLLPSGNDSAYVLAKYTGEKISNKKVSTEEAIVIFIKAINEKAKSIGANNSNFLRPDGYDKKGQYTTASDLACIAKYFMKSKILSDIVCQYQVNDEFIDGSKVTYENTNELINPYSEYYYSNIKGLKTGSSSSAGKCVVSAADIDNKTYICVVMGSSDEGRWLDSLYLYQCIK